MPRVAAVCTRTSHYCQTPWHINYASNVAQIELDDLLENTETFIVDDQPKVKWQKRMELREESWESFRSQLFERAHYVFNHAH